MNLDNPIIQRLQHSSTALTHLLHSFDYARDVGCDEWEFALNIDCLKRDGLREADLRWLAKKGMLRHAEERTKPTDRQRRFQVLEGHLIGKNSCFLLTESGAVDVTALLEKLVGHQDVLGRSDKVQYGLNSVDAGKPRWDRDRRALLWTDHVVKQFKVAAPNQEIVLAAFQEESWPVRIDDPLPAKQSSDSKRRLHDTIVSLNRNRKAKLIRFAGDGSGEGIRWELDDSSSRF